MNNRQRQVKEALRKKQQQQNTRRDGLAAVLSDIGRVDTHLLKSEVRREARTMGYHDRKFSEDHAEFLRRVGMLDTALEHWGIGKHHGDNSILLAMAR